MLLLFGGFSKILKVVCEVWVIGCCKVLEILPLNPPSNEDWKGEALRPPKF